MNIIKEVSSNLVLKDKSIDVLSKKHFSILMEALSEAKEKNKAFEPGKISDLNEKNEAFTSVSTTLLPSPKLIITLQDEGYMITLREKVNILKALLPK
jgi:hypothetical protein